jgi:hypothetical protein
MAGGMEDGISEEAQCANKPAGFNCPWPHNWKRKHEKMKLLWHFERMWIMCFMLNLNLICTYGNIFVKVKFKTNLRLFTVWFPWLTEKGLPIYLVTTAYQCCTGNFFYKLPHGTSQQGSFLGSEWTQWHSKVTVIQRGFVLGKQAGVEEKCPKVDRVMVRPQHRAQWKL